MNYFRFFSSQSWYSAWVSHRPDLEKLLKCFDTSRNADPEEEVINSVYASRNNTETLQNVASLYSTNTQACDKHFGVRITSDDCRSVGIRIDKDKRGDTGVRFVDDRHADLVGTSTQFRSLALRIVQKVWQGEQRLFTYPLHSILGEVAVISSLVHSADEHAIKRCKRALDRKKDLVSIREPDTVELRGSLGQGNESVNLVATRSLRRTTPSMSLFSRFLAWFQRPDD